LAQKDATEAELQVRVRTDKRNRTFEMRRGRNQHFALREQRPEQRMRVGVGWVRGQRRARDRLCFLVPPLLDEQPREVAVGPATTWRVRDGRPQRLLRGGMIALLDRNERLDLERIEIARLALQQLAGDPCRYIESPGLERRAGGGNALTLRHQ